VLKSAARIQYSLLVQLRPRVYTRRRQSWEWEIRLSQSATLIAFPTWERRLLHYPGLDSAVPAVGYRSLDARRIAQGTGGRPDAVILPAWFPDADSAGRAARLSPPFLPFRPEAYADFILAVVGLVRSRLRRTSPSGSRGYLASVGFLHGARSPSLFSPMTLGACCRPSPRRAVPPQIVFGVTCCLRQ
jgi:hypothetical protein